MRQVEKLSIELHRNGRSWEGRVIAQHKNQRSFDVVASLQLNGEGGERLLSNQDGNLWVVTNHKEQFRTAHEHLSKALRELSSFCETYMFQKYEIAAKHSTHGEPRKTAPIDPDWTFVPGEGNLQSPHIWIYREDVRYAIQQTSRDLFEICFIASAGSGMEILPEQFDKLKDAVKWVKEDSKQRPR